MVPVSRLVLNSYIILQKCNLYNTIYSNSLNEKLVITKLYRNLSSSFNLFKSSSKKYDLALRGTLLYENVADKLDYNYFYKEFTMEDTFFSWFLVTEVHVWMLMLRVMQEKDGFKLRNYIVEAMWNDVNIRARKIGTTDSALIKSHVEIIYEQFNASIIGYDEAIELSDKCLAGHVWRRFFKCGNYNPEKLEKFIHYIRKQVYTLEHTTTADIISTTPHIVWNYV